MTQLNDEQWNLLMEELDRPKSPQEIQKFRDLVELGRKIHTNYDINSNHHCDCNQCRKNDVRSKTI